MADLEDSDALITLQRAAELAGLPVDTLRDAAHVSWLTAERLDRTWLTTRRNLHRYLARRKRGEKLPVPPGYQTPEGEEPIG